MKTFTKIATAVALSLGLAAVAYAHPGQMGNCTGQNAQQGCQQQMQGNMGQGHMQGMGMNQGGKQTAMGKNQGQGCDGTMNQGARQQTGQQLMTPDERTAMRDKMRNANSPEERQQIAQANHSEMQKRATEKGITLPEYRGPQGRGMGLNATPATTNPVQ